MRKELISRRKKQQRIRGIITISALIMCIIIVFIVSGLSTNARSVNDHPEYKYFMSYELKYGDTLWLLASTHIDEHYDSIEDYIEELCIINSISEETPLITGTNLILPYYSCEFKQ